MWIDKSWFIHVQNSLFFILHFWRLKADANAKFLYKITLDCWFLVAFWKFQYTKLQKYIFSLFFSGINCLGVLCWYLFPVCYYPDKTKRAIAKPNNPKAPKPVLFSSFFFLILTNGEHRKFFLVPFGCIVCFFFVYNSKMIKFSELCICTKQIICGYLGFELFIFLSLSFPCCCFLIRVVLFRCFIGFLVNPFDIKSCLFTHFLCSPPFFQKEVCFLLVQCCFRSRSWLKNSHWEF